ncbi:MAG: molybdopterin-dependent oxidoreductase [Rhizobiales bacterium]|nr:molybdopterin-dependent oxidoreductase [Hyphomicrobiales bacterium]OJU38204.1 MAG: biotin transporter BioY [Rhizobiales bacterium 68-8]
MLPKPERPLAITHWGNYRVRLDGGRLGGLLPIEGEEDPSNLGDQMVDGAVAPSRIANPSVRKSFLAARGPSDPRLRGAEPFVEVSWDEALALAAGEIDRIRGTHGNGAIFGGSYGWASAGRFHHAQSQIHRFLNAAGGYTASTQNYSYAAGDTILPHVLGDSLGLGSGQTSWTSIEANSELVVMFGGTPWKNAQVSPGGISSHGLRGALARCAAAGVEFVLVGPIRDDAMDEARARWLPVRPATDVALMLGIAHTLVEEGLHDRAFLDSHCTGFPRFLAYLVSETDGRPKSAEWAAGITGIDAADIRALARKMASRRTMIMTAWSLQRADFGEQPYWMTVTLAAMLGQIGLPGGGFGFGYGSISAIGSTTAPVPWPALPKGTNPVGDFIPVARIADMLLNPGAPYDFNGQRRRYPEIRMIYWAGGNPFHHHQDLNRLMEAWRRPETVIVHDSWWNPLARRADIVFPVATSLERNDIAASSRDHFLSASHRVLDPYGASRTDYEVFCGLAERLGCLEAFSEGRDEEGWLRHLYEQASERLAKRGLNTPDFDTFWAGEYLDFARATEMRDLLKDFRDDPAEHPLKTPSGRIEIFSQTIDGFGYDDCRGHPMWYESTEWLGAPAARKYPLHLLSNAPKTRLHSQYDCGSYSRALKVQGREPVRISAADAAARGIRDGDVVRIHNDRGSCLAGAVVSDALRPGVVQLPTGAWFDPVDPAGSSMDRHGNPNVLTPDRGTSKLAQGTSAYSCLVEVERFDGPLPPITCFSQPAIERRGKAG